MFDKIDFDKNTYNILMSEIKKLNSDWISLRKSKEYRVGRLFNETTSGIRRLNFKRLRKNYGRWIDAARSSKKFPNTSKPNPELDLIDSNFFSDCRIAVYTAVFGGYDSVPEPYCKPDNVDYYLITDNSVNLPVDSKWKVVDISNDMYIISNLTNAERNRYYKMHPVHLFPDYEYTFYIDGNIQVVTDITEYIYRLGDAGIATHLHSRRSCIYEEAQAVVFSKRETKENIKKHIKHLEDNGMPRDYGMLECNAILRRNTDICNSLMEEWWDEFMHYSKRDQISLPYVLYKNHIKIEDVGVLGNNIYVNPSFRIYTHS